MCSLHIITEGHMHNNKLPILIYRYICVSSYSGYKGENPVVTKTPCHSIKFKYRILTSGKY